MRLIDPKLPFKIVYAIYHHEFLQFIISSHAVQVLPSGELSLIHQSVHPDNLEQFQSALGADDVELVHLLSEITPTKIIKKLGGNRKETLQFFQQKFIGKTREHELGLIQKRLSKILPMLVGKAVFEMGNDGYPAQTPISVLHEKGRILFHVYREENETRYFPTIKLRDVRIDFQYKNAVLICNDPAWMLLKNELFTFEEPIEGKKIYPFLSKRFISVSKDNEIEYFQKFVVQLIEKYPVRPKGFHVKVLDEQPRFLLKVEGHTGSFSFVRQVGYADHLMSLDPNSRVKVYMVADNGSYNFIKINRHAQKERAILGFLDTIQPNPGTLTPWELVEREKGMAWLLENAETIQNKGIEIIQNDLTGKIHLKEPELVINSYTQGDWFDIQATVIIGKYSIPFIKFRKHILRGKREYILPDNTVVLLPEHWFTDYRHLLEVANENQGSRIRLPSYQAPLLMMKDSAQINGKENGSPTLLLKDIPEVAPPFQLKATLRNYQEKGYQWLRYMNEQKMGCILADDMGLGKTLQTLALLLSEVERGVTAASLIILPTSLIYNWKSEAEKFAPLLKVFIYSGSGRSKNPKVFDDYNLILTTYGIARQDQDVLKAYPFHYVILDEGQIIKNPESKTAKAIQQFISQHRLSLTGTPIENTVMDIWSQMSFLNPGLLGSEHFFRNFYVNPIEKEKNEKRSAQLRKIMYPYILRRTKDQVEQELPPKTEKLHYCEMIPSQADYYEEVRNQYRNYLIDLINKGTLKRNKLNILTGLQKLRQIALHPHILDKKKFSIEDSGKYQETKRLIKQILNRDSKVLIFSQFVRMLDILKQDLTKEKIPFNYLDGSTRDRQSLVNSFQKEEDIRIFLISLKAGGVGLNLTAADYVFIMDPWWNPAVENQAVDRSHRIGQQKPVIYYKFITKDTIEEKILGLQQRKAQLSNDIIRVDEDAYNVLSELELGELFE